MISPTVRGNGASGYADHLLQESILRRLKESLAPASGGERLWIGCLLAGVASGALAYAWQLLHGLRVTAMREYISWGVYMTNFVFFIGVSHAGTLISAILRVTGAEWRRSITRMAEAITVFALMVGAPMVIIDMGRPDRILNVVIHGRFNSPILWDVCSICTYLCGSILYLYIAMLPDLALLAPPAPRWQSLTLLQRIYRALSLGYRGTPLQRRFLERALSTMAVIIIPVAVSVHTVVSWIFGMTLRPGWHSTIFGPYFVIGAIFSGTAAIITAMAIFRKVYHLEPFLTERQFQNLGRLMLALNLLYIYFTLAEYLTTWYGSEETDQRLVGLLMGRSQYGALFWSWAAFGLFLPALIVMLPMKKNLIARLVVASILINIGMWIKRYLIIVPTLLTPYIPTEAAGVAPGYFPTWVEWTVTAGGLSMFMLLFTLFAKIFPIVSIWETVEGVEELGAQHIGVDLEVPVPAAPVGIPRLRPAFAGRAVLLLALAAAAGTALGENKPVLKVPAQITLSSTTDSDGVRVTAEARVKGKPLEGADIEFSVERAFGRLPLATNTTGADGIASFQFTSPLPDKADRGMRIVAEIKSPEEQAASSAPLALPPVHSGPSVQSGFPRALWSPHAPIALVATIATLLSIVWSTYSFVIRQLIGIWKEGKE